jgi:hypothetical protein
VLLTPNEDRDQVFADGSRLIVRQGWMRPHVELIQPERFYDPEKLREYNATRLAEVRARLEAKSLVPGPLSFGQGVDVRAETNDQGPMTNDETPPTASPGQAGAADPSPAADTGRGRRLCEPGEYPDPSSDWDQNQRLGWRYVTGSGMRFGADSIEDLDRWRTWLGRVREFYNQVSVAASGREPSPNDAIRESSLGV